MGEALEDNFRVIGDDKRNNKCNREALEGNFCIIGDGERNDEHDREALEGDFCVVGGDEHNGPVNLFNGAPHKWVRQENCEVRGGRLSLL
jgi:hypothetical protein